MANATEDVIDRDVATAEPMTLPWPWPEVRPAPEPQLTLPLERPAQGSRRHGVRFLLDMLLGATLMVLVHMFVVQISVVKGHSMEPSLFDGDRLVVDRVSYSLMQVARGDVVVLRYPRNPSVDFVKRVVGLPGDHLALRDGFLFVNGELQKCDWQLIPDHENMAEQIVPEGNYFVLGDNRPISCDSREFGLVTSELLKGRVRARFWPLDRVAIF